MTPAIKPFIKDVSVSSDDRGTFVPFLKNANGLEEKDGLQIKRIYYVYNYGKSIVRGFHYHQQEWKYFIIVSGAAKFVAIDPNNPEEKFTFISSARKPNLIVLVCGSTSSFEESIKDDQRFDPYKWGDVWSVKGR